MITHFFKTSLLAFLVALISVTETPAQMPEGAEAFMEARKKLNEALIKKRAELLPAYLANVAEAEAKAAAAGDYTAAAKAKRIQMTFSSETTVPIAEPNSSRKGITLEADDANTEGAISRRAGGDYLEGWSKNGSLARWFVPSIESGSYSVIVEYASETKESEDYFYQIKGSYDWDIQVRKETNFGDNVPLEFELPPTDDISEYESTKVGTLEVSSSSLNLAIETVALSRLSVRLRSITLIPILTDSGTPAPVNTELDDLKTFHHKYLRELATPIVNSYSEKLTAIATDLTSNGKNSEAEKVVAKVQTVKNALATNPIALGYAPPRENAENADSEQEAAAISTISGVTFVHHSENTGSIFRVSYKGVETDIRLYFTEAPPHEKDAAGEIDAAMKTFGIQIDQALNLGASAKEFTAILLAGREFRLTTKGEKDNEGRTYAMVFIPGVGSLQRILASRGLSAISGLPLDPGTVTIEEYRDGLLLDAQAEAMNEKRGGWGL